MNYKKIATLLFAVGSLVVSNAAGSRDTFIPIPSRTQVVTTFEREKEHLYVELNRYVSELSREQLISFYRGFFKKQGMQERKSEFDNAYLFDGPLGHRRLSFFHSTEDGKVRYSLGGFQLKASWVKKNSPAVNTNCNTCSGSSCK